jgi:hypothetical protein
MKQDAVLDAARATHHARDAVMKAPSRGTGDSCLAHRAESAKIALALNNPITRISQFSTTEIVPFAAVASVVSDSSLQFLRFRSQDR